MPTPKTPKRVRIAKRDARLNLLTPQARTIVRHMSDTGSITQREALMDHSVQSLTRRITEIRDVGFSVEGLRKTHPVSGQRYMRYSLLG